MDAAASSKLLYSSSFYTPSSQAVMSCFKHDESQLPVVTTVDTPPKHPIHHNTCLQKVPLTTRFRRIRLDQAGSVHIPAHKNDGIGPSFPDLSHRRPSDFSSVVKPHFEWSDLPCQEFRGRRGSEILGRSIDPSLLSRHDHNLLSPTNSATLDESNMSDNQSSKSSSIFHGQLSSLLEEDVSTNLQSHTHSCPIRLSSLNSDDCASQGKHIIELGNEIKQTRKHLDFLVDQLIQASGGNHILSSQNDPLSFTTADTARNKLPEIRSQSFSNGSSRPEFLSKMCGKPFDINFHQTKSFDVVQSTQEALSQCLAEQSKKMEDTDVVEALDKLGDSICEDVRNVTDFLSDFIHKEMANLRQSTTGLFQVTYRRDLSQSPSFP